MLDGMHVSTEMPVPRGLSGSIVTDERTEREAELDEIAESGVILGPFSEYVERMNSALRDGPDAYAPRISRRYHPVGIDEIERVSLDEMEEMRRKFLETLGEND